MGYVWKETVRKQLFFVTNVIQSTYTRAPDVRPTTSFFQWDVTMRTWDVVRVKINYSISVSVVPLDMKCNLTKLALLVKLLLAVTFQTLNWMVNALSVTPLEFKIVSNAFILLILWTKLVYYVSMLFLWYKSMIMQHASHNSNLFRIALDIMSFLNVLLALINTCILETFPSMISSSTMFVWIWNVKNMTTWRIIVSLVINLTLFSMEIATYFSIPIVITVTKNVLA